MLAEYRRLRDKLRSDAAFRAFHEGESDALPLEYRQRLRRMLGRFADTLSEAELRPRFAAPVAEPAAAPLETTAPALAAL